MRLFVCVCVCVCVCQHKYSVFCRHKDTQTGCACVGCKLTDFGSSIMSQISLLLKYLQATRRRTTSDTRQWSSGISCAQCSKKRRRSCIASTHCKHALNVDPVDAFPCVFLLLQLEHQLNKHLLQLFIAVVDAELLKPAAKQAASSVKRQKQREREREARAPCVCVCMCVCVSLSFPQQQQ